MATFGVLGLLLLIAKGIDHHGRIKREKQESSERN